MRFTVIAGLSMLFVAGCYHIEVETGAPVTDQTYRENWASGFLFGLVPPNTMSTQMRCPNGVAKLEVEHSFPNVLASIVTVGLYTPTTVTALCASGPMKVLTDEELQRMYNRGRGGNAGRGDEGGRGQGGQGGRAGGRAGGRGRVPEDSTTF